VNTAQFSSVGLFSAEMRKLLDNKYTRYSGISGTVKTGIYKALVLSVSEYQSNKAGSLPFFLKIGYHSNVPSQIGK